MERFGIVSADWMTNNKLSLEARGLYAILTTYCNQDRTCFPSSATLMKITGRSRTTIYRWLKELIDQNLISKTTSGTRRIIWINDQLPKRTPSSNLESVQL